MNRGRSIPDIATDAATQFAWLLRTELRLARAEISENFARLGLGAAFFAAAAVLVIPALVILLEAAVAGLSASGIAPGWSALIIGGATIVIALVLLVLGMTRMRAREIIPDKTIHQLREDASMVSAETSMVSAETSMVSAETRQDHEPHRAA